MRIRIQKAIIFQELLIAPVRRKRQGWKEAFQSAPKDQKIPLLMGEKIANQFDQDEWEW